MRLLDVRLLDAAVRLLDAAVRLLDVRRLDVRLRMLDAAVRQFGDVDQTLYRPIEPGKGAECDEFCHLPRYDLADLVFIDDGIPLLRLGPADA